MWKKILVLAWSGFVLSGCVTFPTEEQPPTRGGPPPEAFKRPSGAKVVLVVLENKNEPPALKQPFLEKLMKEGRYLAKYHGVAHPSQPNYIAMVSGSIEGVDRGDADVTLERCHIGRNLSSWIVYAEGYPGNEDLCFTGNQKPYVRKHVPLLSFADVNCESAPDRDACRKIKNCQAHIKRFDFDEFDRAARSGGLPDFTLLIPNLVSDGHDIQDKKDNGKVGPDYQGRQANNREESDSALKTADDWLLKNLGSLLDDPNFKRDVILFVTFDENDDDFNLFRGGYPSTGNKVYAAVWGGHVIRGPEVTTYYDHYDLHRTIEAILGVDERRNCETAPGAGAPARKFAPVPIGGIWQ